MSAVGRQYNTETSFKDVRTRLEQAFCDLPRSTVAGCIATANKQLDKLNNYIKEAEERDLPLFEEFDAQDVSSASGEE